MLQSRLIELSYYDPSAEVRLTAYADTLVLDESQGERTMTAIRFGGYPEGVSFAILIMNAVTPLINRYTQPKPFGRA